MCQVRRLDISLPRLTGEFESTALEFLRGGATDILTFSRLDGLNKPLTDWDMGYYGAIFNARCKEVGMPTIDYPAGRCGPIFLKYIFANYFAVI
jgi:hypothetical protein